MGAHRLSGQHQHVTSRTPSIWGTGTPQPMLPVMRNGTSALPERKRTPARFSTACDSSRSLQLGNVTVNEPLPPAASVTVCSGSSPRTSSNASRNFTWM